MDSKSPLPVGSLKCTLIVHSRDISKQELTEFYRHFSNVVTLGSFLMQKKLIDYSKDDIVLADVRKANNRVWISEQLKYIGENDVVIHIKDSGDSFDNDDTYSKIKYQCKKLIIPSTGFGSRFELMHHLMQYVSGLKTSGTKKKVLKALFKCLCN